MVYEWKPYKWPVNEHYPNLPIEDSEMTHNNRHVFCVSASEHNF